jgi:hypothetical protein
MTTEDNTKVQVFDRVFKERGGRLALAPRASSRLASLLTYYQKRCRDALPDPSFHFDYVNNQCVNAYAAADAGFTLIGCNVGTPIAFLKLYETLLSHPQILPEVGDPSNDPIWEADLSGKDLRDGLADIFPPGVQRITSDSTRARFIHHCTQFAMDFVYWHEIFHVLCGYIGYLGERGGQAAGLAEVDGRRELSTVTRQALEMDADMHAAILTGGIWLKEPLRPELPFRDAEEALRSWAFALAIVFLVFDQSNSPVRDYRHAEHPHPAIRAGIALNSLASFARRSVPHQEAVIDRAWEKSAQDCKDLTRLLKLRLAWIRSWESERDVVIWSTDFLIDQLESIQPDLRVHCDQSLLEGLGLGFDNPADRL